jgi:hypothetical protein
MTFSTAALSTGLAQDEISLAPILYDSTPPKNPVESLRQQLLDVAALEADKPESNAVWERHPRFGYLPKLLESLDISPATQTLVFSKTSMQFRNITPRFPRALYFNDNTYIGSVRGSTMLEIAVTEPQLGTVFYTLNSSENGPVILRDRGECLSCHQNARTQRVPGLVVRSVYPDNTGQPIFRAGSFTTDHRSPFSERWGGWYVTGYHGAAPHMGNLVFDDAKLRQGEGEASGKPVALERTVDLDRYLAKSSDVVALMALQHQTQMHNALIAASFDGRRAEHSDGIMNRALERPTEYRSDSSKRRVVSYGERVVQHLLYHEEAEFPTGVNGDSEFRAHFSARARRDPQGRSLRDFDLEKRLFRYPCSYLIYSSEFDQLPDPVHDYVVNRLWRILNEKESEQDLDLATFENLSSVDRTAIREILKETKPQLFKGVKR